MDRERERRRRPKLRALNVLIVVAVGVALLYSWAYTTAAAILDECRLTPEPHCPGLPFSSLLVNGPTPLPVAIRESVAQLEAFLERASEALAAPEVMRLSLDLWEFAQNGPEEVDFSLELGHIATLVANLDALTEFLRYIVAQLNPSELPQAEDGEPVVVLSLEGLELLPGLALRGAGEFKLRLGQDLNFYLDKLTVRISTGGLSAETELDPERLEITQEQLNLEFQLGAITVRSEVVLGEGQVLRETIELSAQAGDLSLASEATFTITTQEFRIGMTIGDLEISSTSVLTPTGLGAQILSFEMEF